jgi:tetratricopeptide (TPR) repeat protein
MKNLDLIEKYLNEELSSNERSEFEQLQKSDAGFAEEVQVAVTLNADFNVKQKMRWQSLLNEQGSVVKEAPVRTLAPRRSLIWIRNIAAVFILGIGLSLAWLMFSSPDAGTLADDQLMEVYVAPKAFMGKNANADSNWENAISAYREGQFSVAVAAIESSMDKSSEKLDEKHFYLGLSYLYEDVPNYEKAISHLATSKELNSSALFAPKANWFMALAYLKQGKIKEAKTLLLLLINENATNWKKAEATALLNKI